MTLPQPATVLEVLRFVLGSAGYRRARIAYFVSAIESLPKEPLAALLVESHLAGAFLTVVEREGLRAPGLEAVIDRIGPALRAREVFNLNLRAELLNLGARLAVVDARVKPVLLKGAAYWNVYYDAPMARRVRDLDLLIEEPDQADVICDVLEAEGYEALFFVDDPRTVREHFRSGSSYSTPPMRIRRRADLVGRNAASLEPVVRERGSETGLELIDEDGPILTIDVELHRAPFATEEGVFAQSERTDYRASTEFPQFREMTTGAALGYTGVKLGLDILETISSGDHNIKCLKLAADFVRILERCDEADVETAIALARRWQCLHHFADTLQSARMLAPDIVWRGLADPDGEGSLDLLLSVASEKFRESSMCLA